MQNRHQHEPMKAEPILQPDNLPNKQGQKNKSIAEHEDAPKPKRAKIEETKDSTKEMMQRMSKTPTSNSAKADMKTNIDAKEESKFSHESLIESKDENIQKVIAIDIDKTIYNQDGIYSKWKVELPDGKEVVMKGRKLVRNRDYAPRIEAAFKDKNHFENFLFLNKDQLIDNIIAARKNNISVVCVTSRGHRRQEKLGQYSAKALITRLNQLIAEKAGANIGITDIYYTGGSGRKKTRHQKSSVLKHLCAKHKLSKDKLILFDNSERTINECIANQFPAIMRKAGVDKLSGNNHSLCQLQQFIGVVTPKATIQSCSNEQSQSESNTRMVV